MSSDLCQDQIRELAYVKWEQAGCPEGDGINFWLEAEQELIECGKRLSGIGPECGDQPLKIGEPATKAFKRAG